MTSDVIKISRACEVGTSGGLTAAVAGVALLGESLFDPRCFLGLAPLSLLTGPEPFQRVIPDGRQPLPPFPTG